jgi:hypothetical protein
VYKAAAAAEEEEGDTPMLPYDAYGVSPSVIPIGSCGGYSGRAIRLLLSAHRTSAVALTPALLVGHTPTPELVGEARPAGGEAGRLLGCQRGSYQRGSPVSGAVLGSSVCIQSGGPISTGCSMVHGCRGGLLRQGAREEPGRLPPLCASLIGNGRKRGMTGPRCER